MWQTKNIFVYGLTKVYTPCQNVYDLVLTDRLGTHRKRPLLWEKTVDSKKRKENVIKKEGNSNWRDATHSLKKFG